MLSVAAVGVFAMTSCDDTSNSDIYSTYDGTDEAVYFPTQGTTVISAGESDTECTFNVYRASTSAPSTVTLQWSGDTSPFTLPTSVTFADDAIVAPVTFTYVPQTLNPDLTYNLTVTIEGTETTGLTQNYINFSIQYFPMSEWAPFGYDEALGRDGQGYYVFSQYYGGTENPVLVEYSYSLINPNLQEYRFMWLIDNDDPSLGWETFLTATSSDGGKNIVVPEQEFAYNSNYGIVYVSTAALYNPAASSGASYFDDETGTFYLDLIYYVSQGYFGYGYETCTLNGYMDTNEYFISLGNLGSFTIGTTNYQIISFSWNENIDGVIYTVVDTESITEDGEVSDDAIQEIVDKMEQDYVATTYITEQGNYSFDFPTGGDYTVVAAGLHEDADGTIAVKTSDYVSFTYKTTDPNEGWTILGMVEYTDGYMSSLYNITTETWQVEIQEKDDTPGLYRLVDAYCANFPWNDPGDWNPNVTSYLYINAVDPDGVYIPESQQTVNWGAGALLCFSEAAYYMDYGGYPLEAVKNAGKCGTLKNGKITFPYKGLFAGLGTDGWYYANASNDTDEATFCVDFNTLVKATASTATAKSISTLNKGAVKANAKKSDIVKQDGAKTVMFNSKPVNTKTRKAFDKLTPRAAGF